MSSFSSLDMAPPNSYRYLPACVNRLLAPVDTLLPTGTYWHVYELTVAEPRVYSMFACVPLTNCAISLSSCSWCKGNKEQV